MVSSGLYGDSKHLVCRFTGKTTLPRKIKILFQTVEIIIFPQVIVYYNLTFSLSPFPSISPDLDGFLEIVHVVVKSNYVLRLWGYNVHIRKDKHKEITASTTKRRCAMKTCTRIVGFKKPLKTCYSSSVLKYVKTLNKKRQNMAGN